MSHLLRNQLVRKSPGRSTVPAGFVHGMPVGVSFFAGAWQDAQILALAHAFERVHPARRPPRFVPSIQHDDPGRRTGITWTN
jgi:hypothetical protein